MPDLELKHMIRDYTGRTAYLMARFRDEVKAVAAVEFAFLAPLILLLYVGTIEISSAVSANRKLSRAASTLGDLLTQVECVSDNTLSDIVKVIDDIMYPYDNTISISIAGVLVDEDDVTVEWSRAFNMAAATVGSPYIIPDKIKTDGNFLVAVNMSMDYYPTIGWFSSPKAGTLEKDNSAINMEEEMFLRPRIGAEVKVQSAACS